MPPCVAALIARPTLSIIDCSISVVLIDPPEPPSICTLTVMGIDPLTVRDIDCGIVPIAVDSDDAAVLNAVIAELNAVVASLTEVPALAIKLAPSVNPRFPKLPIA